MATLIKVGEVLMKKVVKKFELKDLIKHRYVSHKNLFELCSQYPSFGLPRNGFRVWRKTWPKNCYYTIKDIELEGPSKGEAYGILTWDGKVVDTKPIKIRNPLKRGVWEYAVMDSKAKTENGLVYTTEDLMRYMRSDQIQRAEIKTGFKPQKLE